jgi:catechol 2,3-dioxygenase-like lactoylglutathione lyase family enzyme
MLNQHVAAVTVPVSDMRRAREFYENTLGFGNGRQTVGGTLYSVAGSDVLLFESPAAGTNQATTMGFEVDDASLDRELTALRRAGVDFLTFELEGAAWEDGVARLEGTRSVWFADPDGNIIAVSSGIAA